LADPVLVLKEWIISNFLLLPRWWATFLGRKRTANEGLKFKPLTMHLSQISFSDTAKYTQQNRITGTAVLYHTYTWGSAW